MSDDKLTCGNGHQTITIRDSDKDVIGGIFPCPVEGCGNAYGYKVRHPYIRRMMNRVALHIRWDNATDCGTDATPLDTST